MVSIIIPTYNSEQHIQQCLDSILSQSYSDLEVICVEDGSTDHTLELLEEFAAKDPRVIVIKRSENTGISSARNTAITVARGEWLLFVDSDDWISPDTCERAIAAAHIHQADTVVWCYTREFASQSLPKVFESSERVWEGDEVHTLHRRMYGPYREELSRPDLLDTWGTIWGKLYSKRLVTEDPPITFVDTRVVGTAEDVVFNIDYFSRARKVVYVPKPWYHYRKYMGSYSNRHRDDLCAKWDRLYDAMEQRITTQQLGDDVKVALQNRIALGVLGLGIIAMRSEGTWKEKYQNLYALLGRDRQHLALQQLDLHYFPPHWHIFYYSAKHRLTPLFMAMQTVIGRIINKDG